MIKNQDAKHRNEEPLLFLKWSPYFCFSLFPRTALEKMESVPIFILHPEATADKKRKLLLDLFELKTTTNTNKLIKDFENKKLVVNYFRPTETGVVTEDISSLDPGSDKKSVSEWGGLVEFTSKTNEIVAQLWR